MSSRGDALNVSSKGDDLHMSNKGHTHNIYSCDKLTPLHGGDTFMSRASSMIFDPAM